MNDEWSRAAANSIAHAAEGAAASVEHAFHGFLRPSVLFRPSLSIDGNQWRALYGENLQDGVAGFGDSPSAAMDDFDLQWVTRLPRSGQSVYTADQMHEHGRARERAAYERAAKWCAECFDAMPTKLAEALRALGAEK